jgi:hypothetical protein
MLLLVLWLGPAATSVLLPPAAAAAASGAIMLLLLLPVASACASEAVLAGSDAGLQPLAFGLILLLLLLLGPALSA